MAERAEDRREEGHRLLLRLGRVRRQHGVPQRAHVLRRAQLRHQRDEGLALLRRQARVGVPARGIVATL